MASSPMDHEPSSESEAPSTEDSSEARTTGSDDENVELEDPTSSDDGNESQPPSPPKPARGRAVHLYFSDDDAETSDGPPAEDPATSDAEEDTPVATGSNARSDVADGVMMVSKSEQPDQALGVAGTDTRTKQPASRKRDAVSRRPVTRNLTAAARQTPTQATLVAGKRRAASRPASPKRAAAKEKSVIQPTVTTPVVLESAAPSALIRSDAVQHASMPQPTATASTPAAAAVTTRASKGASIRPNLREPLTPLPTAACVKVASNQANTALPESTKNPTALGGASTSPGERPTASAVRPPNARSNLRTQVPTPRPLAHEKLAPSQADTAPAESSKTPSSLGGASTSSEDRPTAAVAVAPVARALETVTIFLNTTAGATTSGGGDRTFSFIATNTGLHVLGVRRVAACRRNALVAVIRITPAIVRVLREANNSDTAIGSEVTFTNVARSEDRLTYFKMMLGGLRLTAHETTPTTEVLTSVVVSQLPTLALDSLAVRFVRASVGGHLIRGEVGNMSGKPATYVIAPYSTVVTPTIHKVVSLVLGKTDDREKWVGVDVVMRNASSGTTYPPLMATLLEKAATNRDLLLITGKHPAPAVIEPSTGEPKYNASFYVDACVIARMDEHMPEYKRWKTASMEQIRNIAGDGDLAAAGAAGGDAAVAASLASVWVASAGGDGAAGRAAADYLADGYYASVRITTVDVPTPLIGDDVVMPVVLTLGDRYYAAFISDDATLECIPGAAVMGITLSDATVDSVRSLSDVLRGAFLAGVAVVGGRHGMPRVTALTPIDAMQLA